MTYKYAILTL